MIWNQVCALELWFSFQNQILSALFICFVYNQTFGIDSLCSGSFPGCFPLKCESFEFCYCNGGPQMFDMCPDLLRCLSRVCLCWVEPVGVKVRLRTTPETRLCYGIGKLDVRANSFVKIPQKCYFCVAQKKWQLMVLVRSLGEWINIETCFCLGIQKIKRVTASF